MRYWFENKGFRYGMVRDDSISSWDILNGRYRPCPNDCWSLFCAW